MAVIFAQGGSTEKRLAEQLDLAEGYLSEPDYENAIVAYEAAIEIDPGCRDAYESETLVEADDGDVYIVDNIGVIDNEDSLNEVMREFEDLTGIYPCVMTVYDSDWNQDYEELWQYAYDVYNVRIFGAALHADLLRDNVSVGEAFENAFEKILQYL